MILKIVYLLIVLVLCILVCWIKRDNHNSIAFTIAIAIIATVIGLFIFPPDGPLYNIVQSLISPTTQAPNSSLTINSPGTEKPKQTNSTQKNTFQPDYSPGKENIDNDATYKNNYGRFSVQDKMYYFATDSGIYKMNKKFKNCKLISEDKNALYLNVLGDWIYYSTEKGIYKIRTDGSNKSEIIKLDGYLLDMSVQCEAIYYIKSSDQKLYYNRIEGNNEKCICDKRVEKFLCTNLFIFYIEKNDKNTAIALKRMNYDRSNVKTLLKNTYKKGILVDDVPFELCEYKECIVYCNYFGVFLMDKQSGEKTKISKIKGTHSLCVLNDDVYYSRDYDNGTEVKKGILIKTSLTSYKTKNINKPFKENKILQNFYPVDNKIIISPNIKTWYYLDDKNKLHRIDFSINDIN